MTTVLTATDGTHTVELTIHHEDEPWIVGDGDDWIPELELFLDEDGSARLTAGSRHNSDNGTLFSVWHGRDHQWRRSLSQGSLTVADPDRLKEIGEAVLPLLLRVRAGLDTYWDGNNMRGRLSDDAADARKAIDKLLGHPWEEEEGMAWQSDEWIAYRAWEWIDPVVDEGVTYETTDEELVALADDDEAIARSDKVLLHGSTLSARRARRDEARLLFEEEETH
jgi:hypothetical protein